MLLNANVYVVWPDNDSPKEIALQAALTQDEYENKGGGERHVGITWLNAMNRGDLVTQVVQLSGMRGGFRFVSPFTELRGQSSIFTNTRFILGRFSRTERDKILAMAEAIEFNPESMVNGCRVWMRDLLLAMVEEGMIDEDVFKTIDAKVPLLTCQAED